MATDRTLHDAANTGKRLDELHDLIEGIEVAMLVTHALDGTLVARPMQTLPRTDGADLWFMTTIDTGKVEEVEADPEVNACYCNPKSREWVSVSGRAVLERDRARIHDFYGDTLDLGTVRHAEAHEIRSAR